MKRKCLLLPLALVMVLALLLTASAKEVLAGEPTRENTLTLAVGPLAAQKFDPLCVPNTHKPIIALLYDSLVGHTMEGKLSEKIGIAYKEDVAKVWQVLLEVADKNPLCLAEPKPLIIFQGFGDSSIDLQYSVWVRRDEYLTLKNEIQMDIKAAFDQQDIEIPFPHRTLYAGSVTDPLPVNIVSNSSLPEPG